MDKYPQIISMPGYLKKNLFSILVISVLSFFIFLGVNYNRSNLASLSGIITAWVTINPLEVDVSAPAEVQVDRNFKVEAVISNKGGEAIEKARAEIHLPSGLILAGGDTVREIKVIPAKRDRNVSWGMKGEEIGGYVISVSASGELKGEAISAEDSALVEVKEFLPRGRAREWFQNLFDFFQKMF